MSVLSKKVRWRRHMRDKDGVASVIGTIFALLVFITILSLVITSYIPAWEKQNEQEFMTETVYRFSNIKSVNGIMAEDDEQFVAVSLSPSEVPIFGKTVLGNLSYHPSDSPRASMTLSFNSNDTAGLEFISAGSLEFGIQTNTQLSQRVSYELGAVLVSQPDGGLVRASPMISYSEIDVGGTTNYDLVIGMNELGGTEDSRIGTGTYGVSMKVTDKEDDTYIMGAGDRDATIVIETQYPNAWESWLDLNLVQTGVLNGLTVDGTSITMDFSNINSIQIKRTWTEMSLE